jgi:adenylate cyclase class IV
MVHPEKPTKTEVWDLIQQRPETGTCLNIDHWTLIPLSLFRFQSAKSPDTFHLVASNIEIKAVAKDGPKQKKIAEKLADHPPQWLVQEDVFFRAAQGRLKLQILGPKRGESIAYSRPDRATIRQSVYEIVGTTEPQRLRITLAAALATEGTVRKRRCLYHCGQTRIHFDEVQDLGRFIELEGVLRNDQAPQTGTRSLKV